MNHESFFIENVTRANCQRNGVFERDALEAEAAPNHPAGQSHLAFIALSPLGRGWPEGPVRGLRMAICPAKAHPPHPNPLPGGERELVIAPPSRGEPLCEQTHPLTET
ncbi:hypothetical protein GAY30_15045 [Azospirillum brasilense]|nr:hypothetical protein [Azospirillum brasilense]NUB36213.1 hypothetical protein [Azospirillum brasilense]RIV98861.1 hypothetical protein D2T81_24885 [Azospirillum brasilense]